MQPKIVYYIYSFVVGLILYLNQVSASDVYVVISNDGPVVLGGTITFRADLYSRDGSRPSGKFSYSWADNALNVHEYETEATTNTTTYWTISYPAHRYSVGSYRVEVVVRKEDLWIFWPVICRELTVIEVTNFLNGNMTVEQSNKTLENNFVSSQSAAEMKVDVRKGDYDYIVANATSISTYWFVDCEYFGQSTNFTFDYNFTKPNTTHTIEALVIASFYPPVTTTTVAPTTSVPSTTTSKSNTTTVVPVTTSEKPKTTIVAAESNPNVTLGPTPANISYPFVCLNSSVIQPDPRMTYGYFIKKVEVRAPISNITVDGTHWLQPWEMLSLNVSCNGTGPFHKCLSVYRGQHNVTGNETCDQSEVLESCDFSIVHYFLEPSVYTIVVILNNDVSKHITPLTINIYKATPKPQLSVIVVPVSCSLAAVVLIVFGVAYYIQSRARFTVEVADFDFGQHNPEMEYKTFRERLRDSFNSTLRPGADRISGYEPLNKPLLK